MSAVFALALLTRGVGSVLLFALISFFAPRVHHAGADPARRSPYVALGLLRGHAGPVLARLERLVRAVRHLHPSFRLPAGADAERPCRGYRAFLERTATIQWALMICVYCVSYAPALLTSRFRVTRMAALSLLFLVIVVQSSDVMQYIWGKLIGRHRIAPTVSPNKTWEGFLGGIATATLIGTGLWWVTPFAPWEAAVMSLVITLMGFAGGLTMSAIKRDRGVKDFGTSSPDMEVSSTASTHSASRRRSSSTLPATSSAPDPPHHTRPTPRTTSRNSHLDGELRDAPVE